MKYIRLVSYKNKRKEPRGRIEVYSPADGSWISIGTVGDGYVEIVREAIGQNSADQSGSTEGQSSDGDQSSRESQLAQLVLAKLGAVVRISALVSEWKQNGLAQDKPEQWQEEREKLDAIVMELTDAAQACLGLEDSDGEEETGDQKKQS